MKILILSRYGALGASSRVRFYQYLPFLQAQGIQAEIAPFFADDYLRALQAGKPIPIFSVLAAYLKRLLTLFQARHYDLLWVEKQLFPWLPAWFEQILPRPYVVDYDDAVFHRYDLHPNPLIRWALGGSIDQVMRRAALVTAGNAYLQRRAQQAGASQIEILPSVVDADRYLPASLPPAGDFRLGWLGQPSTVAFLSAIKVPLQQARLRQPVELLVMGAQLPGLQAAFHPWQPEREPFFLQQLHAGIMPLPDAPFERGKCGYKLIQYMACGLPVIASPVGVNAEIVLHQHTGLLASTQDEWREAILNLAQAPDLRRQMGQAGRARFEAEYSLQVHAPRLLRFLKQFS